MIYQFRSKAGPDVIMLTDLTRRIFDAMGRNLENRGILTPDQIPSLISKLEEAIALDLKDLQMNKGSHQEHNQNEIDLPPNNKDRLGQRAFPFLMLMKQANSAHEPIVWGV